MPDASPVKWHLAHTTWFFETFVLAPNLRGYRPFDPAYRVLFNSYYNAVGEKHPRPERGMLSRPGLDEVLAYRRHVDQAMHRLLAETPVSPALAELIELGSHHEQQHQELILTDLKHLLSRNPLRPAYQKPWPLTPRSARACAAGSPAPGGCRKSGTPAADSASTTRRRAIASGWSPSASPRTRSRTATSSSSSTTAATAGPSCGSRPGGTS